MVWYTVRMSILSNLYLSAQFRNASLEGIAVYTYLRTDADGGQDECTQLLWTHYQQLASFNDVHSIGQALGKHSSTVQRPVDEIVRLGWVQPIDFMDRPGYLVAKVQDGQLTYLIDAAARVADDLKAQAAHRQRLTQEADAALKTRKYHEDLEKANAKLRAKLDAKKAHQEADIGSGACALAVHFGDRHEELFGDRFPGVDPGSFKGRTYQMDPRLMPHFRNLRQWAGSLEEGKRFLDFVTENWEAIKDAFNVDGDPTPFLFLHPNFFQRVRSAMKNGLPTKKRGIADRASTTDWDNAKDGW